MSKTEAIELANRNCNHSISQIVNIVEQISKNIQDNYLMTIPNEISSWNDLDSPFNEWVNFSPSKVDRLQTLANTLSLFFFALIIIIIRSPNTNHSL